MMGAIHSSNMSVAFHQNTELPIVTAVKTSNPGILTHTFPPPPEEGRRKIKKPDLTHYQLLKNHLL
jgi:hypothetical protein